MVDAERNGFIPAMSSKENLETGVTLTQYHNPLQHHHTKFFAAVPRSYTDAVLQYGPIINCSADEWDARPIEANAAWLLKRFHDEYKRLKMSVSALNKQVESYRTQQSRLARYDADYLPYEEDDR